MKKRLLFLLISILSVYSACIPLKVQASGQEMYVVLHKRGFYQEITEEINNQGTELDPDEPIFQKTQGLNGVTFSVFDVSDLVQQKSSSEKSFEDIQKDFASIKQDAEEIKNKPLIFEGVTTTGENQETGILSFSLPIDSTGSKAYLIMETKSLVSQVSSSVNTLLMIDQQYVGQTIHLYPKNIVNESKTPKDYPSKKEIIQRRTEKYLPRTNEQQQPLLKILGLGLLFVTVIIGSTRFKFVKNKRS